MDQKQIFSSVLNVFKILIIHRIYEFVTMSLPLPEIHFQV